MTLPRPLRLALAVAGLEAVIYVIIGIVEWFVTDWDKAIVGLSTGLFFVLFGAFLGFCVWSLSKGQVWARAPIVMTQLIQIPVAISFWDEGWTAFVALAMFAFTGVTLAGVFHPESLQALADDE